MSGLRRLIGEIHRRSIWQVLGIYLVASWGALQIVNEVSRSLTRAITRIDSSPSARSSSINVKPLRLIVPGDDLQAPVDGEGRVGR